MREYEECGFAREKDEVPGLSEQQRTASAQKGRCAAARASSCPLGVDPSPSFLCFGKGWLSAPPRFSPSSLSCCLSLIMEWRRKAVVRVQRTRYQCSLNTDGVCKNKFSLFYTRFSSQCHILEQSGTLPHVETKVACRETCVLISILVFFFSPTS